MNIKNLVTLLGIVVVLALPISGIASRMPVQGLPAYNGTFYGTPGTGSLYNATVPIYSTLHRDNYNPATSACNGQGSGCTGEGCGKHPGVDIRVSSGTMVAAALRGTVVRSECHSSFGGLIVIEATNPYQPGNVVYLSYAHLRGRWVSVGQQVAEGQFIGESGGGQYDACRGVSTGAHLHFQIDRPHGGTYPWFPTGRVDCPDSDFEVAARTYNPIPFLTGASDTRGYTWTFDENNFFELWRRSNVSNGSGTANGKLWIDSHYSDPTLDRGPLVASCGGGGGYPCSSQVLVETDIYGGLILNLNYPCSSNPVELWFRNSFGEWGAVPFSYTGPGWYWYNFYFQPQWRGYVTDLKVVLSQGCSVAGPEHYVDYIYVAPRP